MILNGIVNSNLPNDNFSTFKTSCGTLKSIKGDIDWKDFLSEYDFRIKGKKRMDSILIGRCILNCDTKLQKEILNIIERSRFLESAQKKINKLK